MFNMEEMSNKQFTLRVLDEELDRLAHLRKSKLNELLTTKCKEARRCVEELPDS